MLADPSVTFGEMLAALIKFCPEGKAEELYQALNELGEDRRGPHRWAANKLEMRRHGRDARRPRGWRIGKDLGPENLTHSGSPIEEFRNREDRELADEIERGNARTAGDMALDHPLNARARRDPGFRGFRARYPGASRIERF